jgi:hypothetical protein
VADDDHSRPQAGNVDAEKQKRASGSKLGLLTDFTFQKHVRLRTYPFTPERVGANE